MKKIFDFVFSILVLIVSLPLFIVIALLIKLNDHGPVFFTHERIGYKRKPFQMIKFRTMSVDAEARLAQMLEDDEIKAEWEKSFKLKNDPRITFIGKFLRKTSLDELPQFINVLKGEMSVVGPRPVVQQELEKYYKGKEYIFDQVKPGITGLWQVTVRNDTKNYKLRIKLDELYLKKQSLWYDLLIILKTIQVVITGKGAY